MVSYNLSFECLTANHVRSPTLRRGSPTRCYKLSPSTTNLVCTYILSCLPFANLFRGPLREDRPDVLFQIYVGDAAYRRSDVWTEDNRVVLDGNNHAVNNFEEIPWTCSTEMEGWLMEAIQRQNPYISISDFVARMPHTRGSANKPLKPFGITTYSNRTGRFRKKAGCLSLKKRAGTDALKEYLTSLIPKSCLDANSTRAFRDLTTNEIANMERLNKNKFKERAGINTRGAAAAKKQQLGDEGIENNMQESMPDLVAPRRVLRSQKRQVEESSESDSDLVYIQPSKRPRRNYAMAQKKLPAGHKSSLRDRKPESKQAVSKRQRREEVLIDNEVSSMQPALMDAGYGDTRIVNPPMSTGQTGVFDMVNNNPELTPRMSTDISRGQNGSMMGHINANVEGYSAEERMAHPAVIPEPVTVSTNVYENSRAPAQSQLLVEHAYPDVSTMDNPAQNPYSMRPETNVNCLSSSSQMIYIPPDVEESFLILPSGTYAIRRIHGSLQNRIPNVQTYSEHESNNPEPKNDLGTQVGTFEVGSGLETQFNLGANAEAQDAQNGYGFPGQERYIQASNMGVEDAFQPSDVDLHGTSDPLQAVNTDGQTDVDEFNKNAPALDSNFLDSFSVPDYLGQEGYNQSSEIALKGILAPSDVDIHRTLDPSLLLNAEGLNTVSAFDEDMSNLNPNLPRVLFEPTFEGLTETGIPENTDFLNESLPADFLTQLSSNVGFQMEYPSDGLWYEPNPDDPGDSLFEEAFGLDRDD